MAKGKISSSENCVLMLSEGIVLIPIEDKRRVIFFIKCIRKESFTPFLIILTFLNQYKIITKQYY